MKTSEYNYTKQWGWGKLKMGKWSVLEVTFKLLRKPFWLFKDRIFCPASYQWQLDVSKMMSTGLRILSHSPQKDVIFYC